MPAMVAHGADGLLPLHLLLFLLLLTLVLQHPSLRAQIHCSACSSGLALSCSCLPLVALLALASVLYGVPHTALV